MNAQHITAEEIVEGRDQERAKDFLTAVRWAWRRSALRQLRTHRIRLLLIAAGGAAAIAVLLRLLA